MEYEKCLVQVYEILNHLNEEEMAKIPEKVIKSIEEKMDKNYTWHYDETKSLNEQIIDRKTVAILSYINIEYLLDEDEKIYIKKLHKENEERLFPKISFVNFNKPKDSSLKEEIQDKSLAEVKEQKWYKKIFVFFKNLFNRKG